MCDFSRPNNTQGLLVSIKAGAPKLWESLEHAATLGLIFQDYRRGGNHQYRSGHGN
ncbi:hypothetical protein [uncultured Desulfobacter sp.]|uniref:hypothetical protein n=1 Tax=uncultured Desulfobacter sp. TaxID=240139 RepID=UPI002AA6491C|nr:hypothetical protein [uncultured Desulfobacter sp.]